jgi:hypothetical protein
VGKSVLGALGVDVGLLDNVEARGRIRPEESKVFYQILSGVQRRPAEMFLRLARDNLTAVKQEWEERLREKAPQREKILAQEVVRRALEGRYSVAMLFNEPEPQIGRLFVFDGVARRATRVEVGGNPAGGSMDVSHRYAMDHYYELEVFTDDSQNFPIIFCVCDLPEGFPTGADIRVPVRVAGFFFKNWLYTTRGRPVNSDGTGDDPSGPQAQYAPLLIGRAPIVMSTEQGNPQLGRFLLGGLFVLGLVAIWAAAICFARDDRLFRKRTPSASFSLPPGESLDQLNVPAVSEPMNEERQPSSGAALPN